MGPKSGQMKLAIPSYVPWHGNSRVFNELIYITKKAVWASTCVEMQLKESGLLLKSVKKSYLKSKIQYKTDF